VIWLQSQALTTESIALTQR